jgi:hypothetical protein
LVYVKEITLTRTGKHAIIVDDYNTQWFCNFAKEENQSELDYLIDVFLYFISKRVELFDYDMA